MTVHRSRYVSVLIASCLLALPMGSFAQGSADRGSQAREDAEREREDHEGKAHPKHQAKVALDVARKLALEQVPGKVVDEELERERGQWVYSFSITPDGANSKVVKEVNIDADSGALLSVEDDRD